MKSCMCVLGNLRSRSYDHECRREGRARKGMSRRRRVSSLLRLSGIRESLKRGGATTCRWPTTVPQIQQQVGTDGYVHHNIIKKESRIGEVQECTIITHSKGYMKLQLEKKPKTTISNILLHKRGFLWGGVCQKSHFHACERERDSHVQDTTTTKLWQLTNQIPTVHPSVCFARSLAQNGEKWREKERKRTR